MGFGTFAIHPLVVFLISVLVMWLSARIGASIARGNLEQEHREDVGIMLGASLTLLALIIGFTFSMAVNRYDQRKTFEEAEANAIGTEYLRLQLLPAAAAARSNALLITYLDKRIAFYSEHNSGRLQLIDADTAQLQTDLWSAVRPIAAAKPTPVNSLVLAGMNDVLNSQGYTQAAWWNRIPIAAWGLLAIIGLCANVLVGYASHRAKRQAIVLLIVPILASIAFLLIAELDSPGGGLIAVKPQNLVSLAASLGVTVPSKTVAHPL
jgi:hypothetical protein